MERMGKNTMIHYHGGPITPVKVAVDVWSGSHAFISFVNPDQIEVAAEICQSFALDNGAFSMWKQGIEINWENYYIWVEQWMNHPGFDFAVIPDVIDGNENENDELIKEWRYGHIGAPVWHMHESIERLEDLCRNWPRVCMGSSGDFAVVGDRKWWERMDDAMAAICADGRPRCKLHGLRMLDPRVFQHLPLKSGDSTNVAQNHNRAGHYIIQKRVESMNSVGRWKRRMIEGSNDLFGEEK